MRENLEEKVDNYFRKYSADEAKLAEFRSNPELLRSALAEALKIPLPPRPDDVFEFEGAKTSPRDFLHKHLQFNAKSLRFIVFSEKDTETQELSKRNLIKKALLNRHTVPVFIAGHVALAVDFKTANGHFGEMSPAELEVISNEPMTALLVKDSVPESNDDVVNRDGTPITTGSAGNYKLYSNLYVVLAAAIPNDNQL